jgi:hypothetical protein
MVRVAAQDREAAVDLLEQDHPGQPVRQRDPTERDQLPGPPAQHVGVAVGPADRKGDRAAPAVLLLPPEERGHLLARDEISPLVERDQERAVGQRAQERGLVLALVDGEPAVRAQPPGVLRLGGAQGVVLQAADRQDRDLQ